MKQKYWPATTLYDIVLNYESPIIANVHCTLLYTILTYASSIKNFLIRYIYNLLYSIFTKFLFICFGKNLYHKFLSPQHKLLLALHKFSLTHHYFRMNFLKRLFLAGLSSEEKIDAVFLCFWHFYD